MSEVQATVTGEVRRWPTVWCIQDGTGYVHAYSSKDGRDASTANFDGPVRLITIPGTDGAGEAATIAVEPGTRNLIEDFRREANAMGDNNEH